MIRQRLRTNLIALLAISLTLTFVQTPQTPAFAAFCVGPAAYPPDLPDCLDPVVEAQKIAAAAAAAAQLAIDNARILAASNAAKAEADARDAAVIKARVEQAAADALALEIQKGNLAAAATLARAAAETARAAAATALAEREAAARAAAKALSDAALVADELAQAQIAFNNAQAQIAKDIADANAELARQRNIALEKQKLLDAAEAKFALDRIDFDRKIAEAEVARIAAQATANASAGLVTNARREYVAAGGVALRAQNDQSALQSVVVKKQTLLTQPKEFSNLKIQSETSTVFATAEETLREALGVAYRKAEAKAIEDQATLAATRAAEERERDALDLVEAPVITARNNAQAVADLITVQNNKIFEANDLKNDLLKVVNDKKVGLLSANADIAAKQADLDKKKASEEAANSKVRSYITVTGAFDDFEKGIGNAASLGTVVVATAQRVATAASAASDAAADAAATAERNSIAQANAIRLRQESDAAAGLAARNPSYSGPSVNSLELAAAQAEKEAKETERKAKEAKEAEEKALAEKKAAEDAAVKAKAAADKAAADSLATEESKRNAARNQIAKDRAVSKKVIQKIQGDAQKNTEKIIKSAIDIKSAYELALDQLVKVNKSMALLKEKENVALSTLNQTKSELLTASNSLQSATQKQGIAVAKQAEANYATVKIQVEIDSNKKAVAENEKSIKVAQTTLNDATKKYEKLNATAQSATAKAAESKRVEEVAYNAWQSSLNATKLTASLTFSDSLPTETPQTANAQSALSKLKEQYDLARKQYEIEKAFADKAVAEANLAKRVVETAKSNLEIRVSLKATLVTKIDKLTGDLTAAKSILKSATAEKAIAVANYTKSENEYAAIKSKFSQSEITYQSAKADTKYEFENATSQNNQVLALRKLSAFSKNSVAAAKDVLNSIQDEAKKLENSKIVGFLNDNSNLATIPLPVFIIGISVVTTVAIFAYLRRRQRRAKMSLINQEIIERLIQKNLAKSKPKIKSKSGLKAKPKSKS